MTGPERHREPRTERRERPHAGSALGNGVMRSALYWEGLCELRTLDGRRVGRGYLELTGYGGALRL